MERTGGRERNERGIGETERDGEEKKIWRVVFWNVAGLMNKDRAFWER